MCGPRFVLPSVPSVRALIRMTVNSSLLEPGGWNGQALDQCAGLRATYT